MLIKFAGISFNFDEIKSSYSVENTVSRDLPSDEEIESYWKIINKTNQHWAYYFGVLAAFGLRPQEPFYSSRLGCAGLHPTSNIVGWVALGFTQPNKQLTSDTFGAE